MPPKRKYPIRDLLSWWLSDGWLAAWEIESRRLAELHCEPLMPEWLRRDLWEDLAYGRGMFCAYYSTLGYRQQVIRAMRYAVPFHPSSDQI